MVWVQIMSGWIRKRTWVSYKYSNGKSIADHLSNFLPNAAVNESECVYHRSDDTGMQIIISHA